MQALAAASKTVDCLKIVHSLHAYFLLVGDFNSKYLFTRYMNNYGSVRELQLFFFFIPLDIPKLIFLFFWTGNTSLYICWEVGPFYFPLL